MTAEREALTRVRLLLEDSEPWARNILRLPASERPVALHLIEDLQKHAQDVRTQIQIYLLQVEERTTCSNDPSMLVTKTV